MVMFYTNIKHLLLIGLLKKHTINILIMEIKFGFIIIVWIIADTTKCIQIYTSSKIKNIHININI